MKMNKKMLKVAVTTAMVASIAVPAFANPFSDVPAKHWAYDAVNKLSQAGIVDGYSDGTFKGDKTITRYEMAQIVGKAMTKTMNTDQKASVERLKKEFAVELSTMGIKVDEMQDQINNMVKISGDARVRYFDTANNTDYSDYRARVTFDGKINDNVKFNARLSSGSPTINSTSTTNSSVGAVKLDTANVTFNALGLTNTVGRQDIKLGTGFMMDTQMNGIASNIGALKLFGGNASSNATGDAAVMHMYGAEYGMNIGEVKVNADYLKENVIGSKNIYGINTSFDVANGVTAKAEYVKNSTDAAKAYAYGVKFNNIGFSATYRNVDGAAFNNFSTMVNPKFDTSVTSNGFKGMEYQYDRALDKNVNLTVKYQDFKNKIDGTKIDGRTSAVVNVKF